MPVLLAEVTQAWEAATATEAANIVAMLDAKTSSWEASVAQDSGTLHAKEAEDRAALVEREAQERMSRMEAENAAVLASACEDDEGLI
jgi:hypothetical protein